jgi:hypothetical protein
MHGHRCTAESIFLGPCHAGTDAISPAPALAADDRPFHISIREWDVEVGA